MKVMDVTSAVLVLRNADGTETRLELNGPFFALDHPADAEAAQLLSAEIAQLNSLLIGDGGEA